ncbi:ABC transporter permease subunit [Agreia sp. Leaf210]|uniref:ABC transporter permease subunit n=1 Tax=Agreia sp. Leaf210 TaxID=1735682 RepID=UPI000AE58419|nr:ABC transporter permease subunit [Agreia sp. Leaf210]
MSTLERRRTFVESEGSPRVMGVVRSEFIKITSLRSTVGLLLSIVVIGIGVSVLLALTMYDAGLPETPTVGFMLDQVTIGTVLFGQLIAGVLGALVISGEYSSGSIQTTLIAVPSRLTVLGAKAAVVFGTVTGAGLVAAFGSWAVTYPMFAGYGLDIGLREPGVLLALVGTAVYIGLTAVLGLGVGTLLRSVAASVATVISIILLLPLVLSVLPASQVVRNIHLLTMSKAGDAMSSSAADGTGFVDLVDGFVSPGAGWIVAAVWAAVLLVLGGIRFTRRDT